MLQSLYNHVLVPFEVCQEILTGGSSGFAIAEFEAATWLQKQQTPLNISPLLLNSLDRGEAAVIQLAENTVLTYTGHDLEYIKSKGCDHSWVLNQNRAGSCDYLVCCHSQGAKQRSAFLVGLISGVKPVDEERWAIHIYEYASVDIPNV